MGSGSFLSDVTGLVFIYFGFTRVTWWPAKVLCSISVTAIGLYRINISTLILFLKVI